MNSLTACIRRLPPGNRHALVLLLLGRDLFKLGEGLIDGIAALRGCRIDELGDLSGKEDHHFALDLAAAAELQADHVAGRLEPPTGLSAGGAMRAPRKSARSSSSVDR